MKLRPVLLWWLVRQTWPVTAVALVVTCLAVILSQEKMGFSFVFIPVHSFAIVACLGRFRSAEFAYAYGRGYSRDTLWLHMMLATILAVAVVWLPNALFLWLPIRSVAQQIVWQNPEYPVSMARDAGMPWTWLPGYGYFLPVFHYVWLRQAYPAKHSDDGIWLAVALVALAVAGGPEFLSEHWYMQWLQVVGWAFYIGIPILLLFAGWRLHRQLEAQS